MSTPCCEGVAAYMAGAAWDVLHNPECPESPHGRPRNGGWMQTHTGRAFWPLDPRAEDVDPLDIAHALSHLCRYGGHVKRFYSVAEHCWHISQSVAPQHALWGLLHDASEAYLVDLPRPIKRSMPSYIEAERRVQAVICERFGLDVVEPAEVKAADSRILLDERAVLLGPMPRPWAADLEQLTPLGVTIRAHEPKVAKSLYLSTLELLGVAL